MYKSKDELKKELGNEYEDYLYSAGIELLKKIEKIKMVIKDEKLTNEEKLVKINDEVEEKY